MKQPFTGIMMILLLLLPGCGDKDPSFSGTVSINNELSETVPYYSLGFSFSKGVKVSTNDTPGPDITVEAGVLEGGVNVEAFLAANTLDPPFALYGTYGSLTEAKSAFSGLTSFGNLTYQDFGSPLTENQIWIMRTRDENYAKIRIIETSLDTEQNPDFASCKFEWVYQPDGTKIFPATK